ncbi:hypothetical protein KSP39_PZI007222 [Platanthera zijinensis]|uniref:Protein FAR1-RELATED SEQUENCE n=1 Tax=Platanthera zijinensis TaxID=2320716 RepID=A0AAP0BPV0_9ASPA
MNNICHAITKASSSLVGCFLQMEKMINNCREKEKEEDFRCKHGTVHVDVKNCPILKQVSKMYTRTMYGKFYEGFKVGMEVRWCDRAENNKYWTVELDLKTFDISCSCCKFETNGILCSHALKAYTHKNLTSIPEKYVLRRWMVHAKRSIYRHDNLKRSESFCSLAFRNHMCRAAYDLALRVEKCEITKKYVLDAMEEISHYADSCLDNNMTGSNLKKKSSIKDPPRLRPKGVSNARIKDHWEKPSTFFCTYTFFG